MRRLVSLLGMPQHRFASIHVVGTNGKSSVTRYAAALLEAGGVRSGAYLSPHFERWTERVTVGTEEIDPEAFAGAVERAAQAAEAVNRTLDEGDAVTQFELVTAAAFVALASARVQVAVIEAGLGGRLDATNVIPSKVTALTSISLEHTDLLGDTEAEIAREKLAVLRRHSTLVLGRVSTEIEELAEQVSAERSARLIRPLGQGVPEETAIYGTELQGPPLGGFLKNNFAVASAAVEAITGPVDASLGAAVQSHLQLPGVLELIDDTPPLILDAAHNPGGAKALAEALPAIAQGRPVVACIAMLEGKDIQGFAQALSPALSAVVCTQLPDHAFVGAGRPGSHSVEAGALAAAFDRAGASTVVTVPEPEAALAHARRLAGDASGLALATGTHYLLPYIWTGRPAQNSSR